MSVISRACLLFALLLLPVSAHDGYIAIEIQGGQLFIEGQPFKKESSMADYEKVLGKPSRSESKANIIHTYDKLGITVYQNPKTMLVVSFGFQLVRKNYSFSPKATLHGIFIIEDKVFRIQTSQKSLLDFGFIKIKEEEKKMRFPVTKTRVGDITVIFVFISNLNQLDEVGISWRP